jgi:hypothetical protein
MSGVEAFGNATYRNDRLLKSICPPARSRSLPTLRIDREEGFADLESGRSDSRKVRVVQPHPLRVSLTPSAVAGAAIGRRLQPGRTSHGS